VFNDAEVRNALPIDVEQAYQRYGPMVLRRCRKLLRDEQMAVEVMQDTFVQLLHHSARLEASGLSSMLYRIATNLSINRIRQRGRHPEDSDQEILFQIAACDEPEEHLINRLYLGRLFSSIHSTTRTIAVMHLLDQMTLEEVASETGLSVSGVRKRLRKLKLDCSKIAGARAAVASKGE
jgi:RNA polymerase sigma-70 factor, ECF subfamily